MKSTKSAAFLKRRSQVRLLPGAPVNAAFPDDPGGAAAADGATAAELTPRSCTNSVHVGLAVEVTNGAAKGAVGRIKERWKADWAKGVPLWLVTFDGTIRQRVLRQDFLRAVTP